MGYINNIDATSAEDLTHATIEGRKQAYEASKQLQRDKQRLERRSQQVEKQIDKNETELARLTEAINSASADGDMDSLALLGVEYEKTNGITKSFSIDKLIKRKKWWQFG